MMARLMHGRTSVESGDVPEVVRLSCPPRLPSSRVAIRLAGVSGPGFNVIPIDAYHAPSHLVPEHLHVAVDHERH